MLQNLILNKFPSHFPHVFTIVSPNLWPSISLKTLLLWLRLLSMSYSILVGHLTQNLIHLDESNLNFIILQRQNLTVSKHLFHLLFRCRHMDYNGQPWTDCICAYIYTYICMHDASLEFKPHLVNSEICSKKFWGSSSPSSCLSCTCSCSGSSASWHLWRCGTRPAPRDRWPRWSCSPSPPRTASSSGTWCCRSTPSDNARWPSHSPDGLRRRLRRRHLSRWTPNLRVGTTRVRFVNNWKPLSCFTRASAWKGKYDRMKYAVSATNLISHNKKKINK